MPDPAELPAERFGTVLNLVLRDESGVGLPKEAWRL